MRMPATGPTRRSAPGRRGRCSTAAWIVIACAASAASMPGATAQPAGSIGSPADVAAVRAAAAAYRKALAAGDTTAVKAAWTADGDIVDGWGERLQPQDVAAIDGGPRAVAKPRPEFRVQETTLRFLTADVAVEDGTVDVVLPGMKNAIEGWFSALWVRRGGTWKLAGLRESERPVGNDATALADLEWMVGDWALNVEEGGGRDGADGTAAPAPMTMSVRWDAGRAFLIREVRVPVAASDDDGVGVVEVHQRIGWDPLVRRIRSWSFSSDGSRGEATWIRDGDSWVATHTGVLPDGRQESAVNIFTHDGRDRCVWRVLPEALEADDGRPTRVIWVRTPKGAGR